VRNELSGQSSSSAGIDVIDGRQVDEEPEGLAAPGIRAGSSLAGEFVYLGANSVPAMALALGNRSSEDSIQEIVSKSVLPLFGLDNESATYPFVDLWGLPAGSSTRVSEICKLLPTSADCFQILREYRDGVHVLFPGVVDLGQMETDVSQFLTKRSTQKFLPNDYIDHTSTVGGKSLHWLGLLFACLASGSQGSRLARKERQLTSQVYGKLSPDKLSLRALMYR
jgi:hypothetical protein